VVAATVHHQNRALAAWTLELEHRVDHSGQQLAAVAAQIAGNLAVEPNLFQSRVHEAVLPRRRWRGDVIIVSA